MEKRSLSILYSKTNFMLFLIMLFLLNACGNKKPNTLPNVESSEPTIIFYQGKNIEERIKCPTGYSRLNCDKNSFAYYLRNIPLLPHESKVVLYNGKIKSNQNAHVAILDVSVGNLDLQQCADAVMRLRCDYLRSIGKEDDIRFYFNNGFLFEYTQWKNGNDIKINGNHITWIRNADNNNSDLSYQKFLEKLFSYAGTLSLSKQLRNINNIVEIEPGDVWIRGGSPGHAAIVMDVAINKDGKKIFLLAQSYMPAQQIHVLKNPNNSSENPWYSIEQIGKKLETPEYTFYYNELKRFE